MEGCSTEDEKYNLEMGIKKRVKDLNLYFGLFKIWEMVINTMAFILSYTKVICRLRAQF